jgi:hypothetical protein
MELVNAVPEDMFEKARAAFFGTAQSSSRSTASSSDFFKPRSEPTATEVTSPSSDK